MLRWLSLPWIVVVCFVLSAGGQTWGSEAVSTDVSEMAAHAGMVFRGRVVAVAVEPANAPGDVTALRITFVVDDAVRGVTPGQTVTIRQWSAAADEYRVGESLVLFLYTPSDALGLTSSVGGRAGHRRVDEVSAQFLDSLREPAVSEVPETLPETIQPRPLRKRPPKKVPARLERQREVAQ